MLHQTGTDQAADAPSAKSPSARRVAAPSWLDFRLILGILLVIASVVVGARVFAGADKSVEVWGMAHDVGSGTYLAAQDVKKVRIRLYTDPDAYLPAGERPPVGSVLSIPMKAGQLLPRSATKAVPDSVVVPLAVNPKQMPPDLTRGSVVNVFTYDPNASSAVVTPVLCGAVVQSLSGSRSGAFGGAASDTTQITVRLAPSPAAAYIQKLTGRSLYVAEVFGRIDCSAYPGGAAGGQAPAAIPSGAAGAVPPAVSTGPTPTSTPQR